MIIYYILYLYIAQLSSRGSWAKPGGPTWAIPAQARIAARGQTNCKNKFGAWPCLHYNITSGALRFLLALRASRRRGYRPALLKARLVGGPRQPHELYRPKRDSQRADKQINFVSTNSVHGHARIITR